jgi:hypothetical protein
VIDANQAGDADYSAAPQVQRTVTVTAAPKVTNPSITASKSSQVAKSKYGWYRTPVTVTFKCIDGTGALLKPDCPDPVTLTKSKKNQSVTETIVATDGGTATVHLTGINIDRVKPTVKVTGVKKGHTYKRAPKLHCKATDHLSGIASCKITTHKKTSHGVKTITYTAKATDKAGNTKTVTGTYKIKK